MCKVQSCHGLVSTAQDQSNCQSAPVAIIMLIIKDFYQTQWFVSKLISWSTFTEFRKSTSASTWREKVCHLAAGDDLNASSTWLACCCNWAWELWLFGNIFLPHLPFYAFQRVVEFESLVYIFSVCIYLKLPNIMMHGHLIMLCNE